MQITNAAIQKLKVLRFDKKGKLSPKFICHFEILERIGPLAYRLALPPNLSTVHNVFHVFMLWKYTPEPTHVFAPEALSLYAHGLSTFKLFNKVDQISLLV